MWPRVQVDLAAQGDGITMPDQDELEMVLNKLGKFITIASQTIGYALVYR